MAINDVLKSYLISLGYEVDSKAFNQFTSALKKAEVEVTKHSGVISGAFTKAGLAYVSAMTTIAVSTGLLLKSLASQEMEYQKTALTLHMAKDAAKQYSIALKVLGEPPEMIAWLPVLREQYRVLRKDSQALELPKAYTEGVHELEAMNLEFKRLKQESMYALQWIGFSIMKHLAGPLEKARMNFKMFNDRLIQQMPVLTSHIGGMFKSLLDVVGNLGKSFAVVGDGLSKFWDLLSPTSKAILGIAILAVLFSKAGPFGQAVIAIGAATFMASQFWSAMEGKETAVPIEYIHKLIQLFDGLSRILQVTIGLIGMFWNALSKNARESVNDVSKIGLAMKRYTLWMMERSGRPKEEIEAQKADIAAHEKAIQTRQGKIQLNEQMTEAYADMSFDTMDIEKWKKEGLSGRLMEKSGGKLGLSDKQREERTQRIIDEKTKKDFISPIGYWGKETPTAGINYGMKGIDKYRDIIKEASEKYGLPEELIAGVIMRESSGRGRPGPVVDVGKGPERAQGLMQLLPSSFGGKLITEDYENIMAGTQYLSTLIQQKGSTEKGLAAYGGFKTKDPTPYITDIMKYAAAYRERGAGNSIQGGVHISVNIGNVTGDGKEAGQKVAEGVVSGMKNNEYIGFLFSGVVPSNYSPIIGPAVQRPTGG